MPTRRALAGLVCLCAACVYNPQFEDGRTRCSPQGECPPGFTCSADKLCRRPATADANNADTAPPSPDGPPPAEASGMADASPPPEPASDAASPSPDVPLPPPDVPPDATTSPLDQREAACADSAECQQQAGFACLGNSLVRCERDPQGCLVIRNQSACPAGLVCTGAAPAAACR